jgi:hypothetical protein
MIKENRDTNLSNYEYPDDCQCWNCKFEQAEYDVLKAMNKIEKLKIEKEKEDASRTDGITSNTQS